MPPSITLRPITPQDSSFLVRVYASTRQEELSLVPWNEVQKTAFLQMQFDAQALDYARNYPDAQFDVILADGEPAGRLYIDRNAAEIHVIDIALLPEYRCQGIGTHLLEAILAEGRQSGRKVSIYVERNNPALRLYERLGFRLVQDHGMYLFMVCHV
jgi:ribosomal protein S18 acetylase RimI-like enzyme